MKRILRTIVEKLVGIYLLLTGMMFTLTFIAIMLGNQSLKHCLTYSHTGPVAPMPILLTECLWEGVAYVTVGLALIIRKRLLSCFSIIFLILALLDTFILEGHRNYDPIWQNIITLVAIFFMGLNILERTKSETVK